MHGLLPVRILRIKSMVEETACPGSKVLRHARQGAAVATREQQVRLDKGARPAAAAAALVAREDGRRTPARPPGARW